MTSVGETVLDIGTSTSSSTTDVNSTSSPSIDEGSETTSAEVPWLAGYSSRKPIRIHPGVELVDFPVAITLSADMDLDDGAQPDGSDLMVTAADGLTELPFEIEAYQNGSLVMWADVGPLSAIEETVVYLYFSGDKPRPLPDGATAWPARYEGVWHMPVNGVELQDSTTSSHIAIADSREWAADVQEGIIGSCANFDSTDTHFGPDPMDGSLDFDETDSLTVSFWVNTAGGVDTNDIPVQKGALGPTPGYAFMLGTGWWSGMVTDGREFNNVFLGEATDLDGDWHLLMMAIDRGTDELIGYLDGVEEERIPLTVMSLSSNAQLIFSPPGLPFDGCIDEFRVQRAAVDPDRAQAHWVNIAEPSAFFTVGELERE